MILHGQIYSFEWHVHLFVLAYLAIFWAMIELDDFWLELLDNVKHEMTYVYFQYSWFFTP